MTSVNTVLEKEELQGRPLDEGLFCSPAVGSKAFFPCNCIIFRVIIHAPIPNYSYSVFLYYDTMNINIKDTFTLIDDTKLGGNNITIICVQAISHFQ